MKIYRMLKLIIILGLLISIYSCSSIKEEYCIGFEKIGQISNDCELIHKNHLLIKGDSAFLYKEPYFVENGDTILSASDGGFYYYRGKINKDKHQTSQHLSLTLINCDYCIRETSVDSITGKEIFIPEIITWNFQTREKLVINNVKYVYQPSELYPIDMISFYESSEFETEESQEIEFTELK